MSIETTNTPAPAATPADAPIAREALLAELEAIPASDEAPLEAEPESAPEAVEAAPAEDAEPADDDADDATPEPAAAAAKPDPDLNSRLEAIQKAERRAKEALAKERAELEAMRKAAEPDLAELAELRELRRRAKLGDSSALLKFGEYADDDAELVARSVYALSKAAAANPQAKEAAARALRERESFSKVSELEQKLANLEKQLTEREQRAQAERQTAAYLDTASKAVTDETPIVRNMFTKSPDLARQRVAMARDYLHQQTGEIPDPVDVLKALEQVERDDLIARGIDPDLVLSKTTKPTTPAAGERSAAKTLSNDLTKQTKPRTAPLSPKEERAELLRALEAGQVD